MDKRIRWLRVSYWVAALADFLVCISVLIPGRVGETQYSYPMGLMSAVAFSWGILLIFADRRPIERRWILLPTILVVALLGSVGIHAALSGIMPMSRIIPTSIISVVILILLSFSYYNARGLQ
jgi:drug/metabolite transporter (DMT)-like permease